MIRVIVSDVRIQIARSDRSLFMDGLAGGVTVTRIGTQVVVRLSGRIDDAMADLLRRTIGEVATLVITRVVVDLAEVCTIEGAGIDFLGELNQRWRLRLINRPGGLGVRLPPTQSLSEAVGQPVAAPAERSSARSSARSSTGDEWVSAPTDR